MKMQKLILSFYLFLAIIISAAAQVSPGIYTLTNKNSNLCLAIRGATQRHGEEGTQWTCDGNADKNWKLIDVGNGDFKIQNQNSNHFLAVGGSTREYGGRCLQSLDTGQPDIIWRFIDAGTGWYKIQNKNSGLFLAIGGGSRDGGADLIQWRDEGQEDIKWKLTSDAIRLTGGNFSRLVATETRPQNKGRKLQVLIRSGSDDLRRYNTAHLTINFINGLSSREYLLQKGLGQNLSANPIIDLDQEIDLAHVRSISIRHDGTPFKSLNPFDSFDTYDNWDLMTLQIALVKHDGSLKNIYNNLSNTTIGDRVPLRFSGEKRMGEFMKQL